jgi:predicted nucleic acid-binding protein
MITRFADTYYYLALLSEDDTAHARAVEFSRLRGGRIVTTTWVLTEVADALAVPPQRRAFLALLELLSTDPAVTIVPPTQEGFDRGVDLYARRLDKNWSLTDCISFVVMEQQGLTEALTADRHFEQAGFEMLLK